VTTIPSPPAGSGPEGRRLWRAAVSDYELDVHELALLRQAVRVTDLCEELHAMVVAEGAVVDGKINPVAVECRLQRILLGRLLAALHMPSGLAEDDSGVPAPRAQHRATRGFYGPRRGDVA